MPSITFARVRALAVPILSLALVPALAPESAAAPAERARPRPVEWLPKPGARRAVDVDEALRREARRFRREQRREAAAAGVTPVDGSYDYGDGIARFGVARPGHIHAGQDVFAPAGTALVAVRDARVVEAGSDGGRGNYVALHSEAAGETYVYFHMREAALVGEGDRVRAGERVGRVGCTGSCQGDHLHFEVRRGRGTAGEAVDPLPLLRRLGRS